MNHDHHDMWFYLCWVQIKTNYMQLSELHVHFFLLQPHHRHWAPFCTVIRDIMKTFFHCLPSSLHLINPLPWDLIHLQILNYSCPPAVCGLAPSSSSTDWVGLDTFPGCSLIDASVDARGLMHFHSHCLCLCLSNTPSFSLSHTEGVRG